MYGTPSGISTLSKTTLLDITVLALERGLACSLPNSIRHHEAKSSMLTVILLPQLMNAYSPIDLMLYGIER
jgi:hypothetical protein